MRINNNVMALNTQRQLGVTSTKVAKSMEKLSSGLRINRASDDAAGLSVSESMRSMIKGLEQGQRNAQDGISFVQTSEGALSEISSMLTRVKELTVQKTNGTYQAQDISDMNLEITALSDEIANIYANTSFNGKNVFEAATISFGATGDTKINIAKTTAITVSSTSTSAQVETAINTVNTQRATFGSIQNRLEFAINSMGTTQENIQSAESRIRDTDMAKEMAELTKQNILQQVSQSVLAQANQSVASVLNLL